MRSVIFTLVFFLLITKTTDGQTLYPTSTGVVGAVYTMSNGATMNQILISSLNPSGQLTMVGAVNTNGTGVNVTNTNGTDVNTTNTNQLISQGSLTVYSNYLFAINQGSNSLSMFMINSSNAIQLTLLSVQSTNGLYPISVTVNSMYACVLNGGNISGIRCFTYNSSGLFVVSSFDRNLTSYISQSASSTALQQTFSEILFSADNLALIVSSISFNATVQGYLLFYTLTSNMTILASNATMATLTNGIVPFSMILVGTNGLLVTGSGAANGVVTLNYSSTTGTISNSMLTSVNATLAESLYWSTYSPNIGHYYVIGIGTATIVELSLNLGSSSSPVTIVQYYQLPPNTGLLLPTVVSLSGKDYLYVLGTTSNAITGYQLNTGGNATTNGMLVAQQGNATSIPNLTGIATFVQTQSSTSSTSSPTSTPSSAGSVLTSMIPLMIFVVFILIVRE